MKGILYRKELTSQKSSVIIWSLVVSALVIVMMSIFPLVKEMYKIMSEYIASLPGGDELAGQVGMMNVQTLVDYFSANISTNLMLVGSVFAAIAASSIMRKEFTDGSAEFLYSLPVKKSNIFMTKLWSLVTIIIIYEMVLMSVTLLSIMIIEGFGISYVPIIVNFVAMTFLHLAIAAVVLSLSSIKKKSFGVGASIAVVFGLYFINMISHVAEEVSFLTYFTPFGVVSAMAKNFGSLNLWTMLVWTMISVGIIIYSARRMRTQDIM